MRRSTMIRLVVYPMILATGLAVMLPVHAGSPRRKRTPVQSAKLARDQAEFARAITAADADFLSGHPESARAKYQALDASRLREPFGIVRGKIAATYAAQGKYAEALAAYRRAERLGRSMASDGIFKAQMIFLAHCQGDEATLAQLAAEAERRDASGPPLPIRVPSADASGANALRNPAVFRRLGRLLAERHHRAGAEWAYGRVLALTHHDATISLEWAHHLSSNFHDIDAEFRILQVAQPSDDAELNARLERELRDVKWYRAAIRANGVRLAAREAEERRLRRQKELRDSFVAWGVFDPNALVVAPVTGLAPGPRPSATTKAR